MCQHAKMSVILQKKNLMQATMHYCKGGVVSNDVYDEIWQPIGIHLVFHLLYKKAILASYFSKSMYSYLFNIYYI